MSAKLTSRQVGDVTVIDAAGRITLGDGASSFRDTIRDLAAERVREVCVVPIAFVSDHVETLGEIDHEARKEASALGIQQFEMTSGLNDSPAFIAALAALVKNAIAADEISESERLVAAD